MLETWRRPVKRDVSFPLIRHACLRAITYRTVKLGGRFVRCYAGSAVQPPYATLLRLEADPNAPGELVMPWSETVVGRPGFVHGGALAGLLEVAALAEARRHLHGRTVKPVGISVEYLRGGRAMETRAAARVVRIGRTVANLAATAWQDDRDRPIAAARLTLLLD